MTHNSIRDDAKRLAARIATDDGAGRVNEIVSQCWL
jgi:hypothetical protein